MKKLIMLFLVVSCVAIISCRESKKEQIEAEATLEKIEMVEKELEETNEDLKNKAKEAEEALNALDI